MPRNKYLIILSAVFLIVIFGFQANENPAFLKNLKQRLANYNASYPEEKVYLQFDKPFYKPGEDIWLNAFVLNSNTHQPTTISDVVYVELIDPKGNIASQLKLAVKEGTAHGDFTLRKNAPGGLYQVRAFTQWMKNFGEENLFRKDIQVQSIITPRLLLKLDYEKESYGPGDEVKAKLTVKNLKNEKIDRASVDFSVKIRGVNVLASKTVTDNNGIANITFQLLDNLSTTDGLLQVTIKSRGIQESISRSIPIVLNKITIQFFPEGGDAIENVSSSIAFKALNEFGKGADVSGSVIDEHDNVISRFESFHMGMGAFEIKPLSGKKYFARIEKPFAQQVLVPLPEALPNGFALRLQESGDSLIHWSVYSSMAGKAHLVGQSHGEIVYSKTLELRRGDNPVEVSTEKFPAGIAVFTLFDNNGLEQCERLVFLNRKKGLNIKIKPNKSRYQPRENVELLIQTTDDQGKLVPAKISVAVVDDQLITFADDKQDNILSSLLLSSEVKGEVQEPSFYFDPEEPKASRAMDYLLMTQGWRRFTWKEVNEMERVITYAPEKVKNLAGRVVNSTGKGVVSEVTLLETGNKRRIKSIKTTLDGHFLFKNIDPTIPILLLTKKPKRIILKNNEVFSMAGHHEAKGVLLPKHTIEAEVEFEDVSLVNGNDGEEFDEAGMLDLSLGSDVSQLSEVIIIGQGVVERSNLVSASVVKVYENSPEKLSSPTVENLLQGRVAGVMVQPQSGNPGAQSNLVVRGISSLQAGRGEPLYVIDGHAIGTSLNQNFSNGSMIGPEEIESIVVVDSPEATALFGSAAANGAILITTRSRLGYAYPTFNKKKKPAKYSSLIVNPRKFSVTREFYIPPPSDNQNDQRQDFRSTIYWNPDVITNEHGEAILSFYNNDAVSAFRVTAEGFSGSGLIGRTEEVYFTQLPYSLDTRIPEYLGFEDTLKLPVRVANETSSMLSGKVTVTIPPALSIEGSIERKVRVPSHSSETTWFTLTSTAIQGEFPINVRLESSDYRDEITDTINVRPIGFPVRLSFSAKQLDKTVRFDIREAERGTLKAELTAFPHVLSDLFTGAESILRQPHGCFEQVSSSTFPNILALQYLKQSGLVQPKIEEKALSYIQDGYDKLTAYEIKGGGFEWFGRPPAHEGLSAFGLLEFHEMEKVFSGVNEKMMDRTRDWLLSRRNGKGGFKQHAGKYGFSAASKVVNNAYITYALTETGTKDILNEYAQALKEAIQSKDMYRMALMTITAYNLGKTDDYHGLVNYFKESIQSTGFDQLKVDHSVVRSYGKSLVCETIAFWALALMKSPDADLNLVNECIQQMLAGRSYGRFGSTQATAMSLKALAEYAHLARTTRDNGEIQVFIDNKIAAKLPYDEQERNKLVLDNFRQKLKVNGEQTLRILFNETDKALPYSVNIQWHTKQPQSSDGCKVSLSTVLTSSHVKVNETVRLKVSIKNKSSDGLPMTVAVVGIPAGLSVQPWQLKELQEKQVFDFYEIFEGNLIIYYRELAPGANQTINLDLKAEIPGTFTGVASAAYLYYTDEYKDWAKGNSIVIHN